MRNDEPAAAVPVRSSWNNWWFLTPARVSKLPMATSRVPAGLMSILPTEVYPLLWMPAMADRMNVSKAPVVGLTVASAFCALPAMCVKEPATHSRPFERRRSLTWPATLPLLNVVTTAPVSTRTLARFVRLWPPMVVNEPPTKTVWPSPVGRTTFTAPLGLGLKVVLIVLVVASKATSRLRAITVSLELFRVWVNVPPRTMVLPTCTTEFTRPSRTCGVPATGTSRTRLPGP